MKKLFVASFVCAMILGMMNSCSMFSDDKEYGSLQGIVSDANTNEPIQGVNITLSPTGYSAVTGSDGRYEISYIDPGQYTVQGVKSGYESNTKRIEVIANNMAWGDMTLTPMATGFRLNVEYLDFGTSFSDLSFKVINVSETIPTSWEVVESMNWMTVTPSSGNLDGGQETAVQVHIDRMQIQQSTTANITVRNANMTIVLPVNVSVSGSSGPQLQLSENSLDFGTSADVLGFYVMNSGPAGSSLNWACSNLTVDWLTLNPMSGNTAGGASTLVTATIDRTKFDGMVSTAVTVNGAGTSLSITINAASSGTGSAILQLSEGSLDFGETATSKTFQVRNVGSAGTVLDWTIDTPTVDWLSINPMSGSTSAGSGTLVTILIDRTKITHSVTTTLTVNGSFNSANISISATYVDNSVLVQNGLFCYFTFDDDDLTDWGGNYTGINAGAVASTDTPSGEGRSMHFNGENSYILIQDNIIPGGGPFSVNFWFKTGRNDQCLIGTDQTDNSSGYGYTESVIKFTNTSCLNYVPYYNGYEWTTASLSDYVDNRWHMLTITFNGNIGMVFIDGTMIESKASDRLKWGTRVNNSYFGTDTKGGGIYTPENYGFYNGKLDNFRSYNRALTVTEIQTLYNAKQ